MRPLPKRPLVSAGLASVCGGVLLLVTAIAIGELGDVRFSATRCSPSAYLVVIGTFVGFTAYVWLLRVAPISLVATYAYVNPIVAVCLGWALLGEEITVQMAVAGSLVVIAVALIVRASGTALEPGRGVLRRARSRCRRRDPGADATSRRCTTSRPCAARRSRSVRSSE